METEQLSENEHPVLDTAWQAYQLWTGTTDETGFRRSYLGHYPSRDAFGQELIHRLGADSRLLQLPDWMFTCASTAWPCCATSRRPATSGSTTHRRSRAASSSTATKSRCPKCVVK